MRLQKTCLQFKSSLGIVALFAANSVAIVIIGGVILGFLKAFLAFLGSLV